jgi:cell division protein FtsB
MSQHLTSIILAAMRALFVTGALFVLYSLWTAISNYRQVAKDIEILRRERDQDMHKLVMEHMQKMRPTEAAHFQHVELTPFDHTRYLEDHYDE